MYEELLRIETEKAERRQKAGKKELPDLGEKVPQGQDSTKQGKNEREPKSSEKAASQVGMSNKTAEKALDVVHAADEMEAEGKVEEAAEIRETLNTRSVAAAARMVAESSSPPKQTTEDQQNSKDIDRLTAKIVGLVSQIEKLAGELFVAIDQKKKTSPAFASRHTKFANMLRKLGELLDPMEHQAGAIATSWGATKKQVDE